MNANNKNYLNRLEEKWKEMVIVAREQGLIAPKKGHRHGSNSRVIRVVVVVVDNRLIITQL